MVKWLKQRSHRLIKQGVKKHGDFVGGLEPLFYDAGRLGISIAFVLIAIGFNNIEPANLTLFTTCEVLAMIALALAFYHLLRSAVQLFVDMIVATEHIKNIMK